MKKIFIDEKEIQEIILNSLREKVNARYTYKYVDRAVDEVMAEEGNQRKLEEFVRSTLDFVNKDASFNKEVRKEFQRKVAKTMVGKLEGTVERAVDKIRQSETLRAEMILAIEKIIKKNNI